VPYFVVVLAGRQARLRPPPRLAQFLHGTFFNLSMGVQYEIIAKHRKPGEGPVLTGFLKKYIPKRNRSHLFPVQKGEGRNPEKEARHDG
jgi:hypothetical protein